MSAPTLFAAPDCHEVQSLRADLAEALADCHDVQALQASLASALAVLTSIDETMRMGEVAFATGYSAGLADLRTDMREARKRIAEVLGVEVN